MTYQKLAPGDYLSFYYDSSSVHCTFDNINCGNIDREQRDQVQHHLIVIGVIRKQETIYGLDDQDSKLKLLKLYCKNYHIHSGQDHLHYSV